MDRRKQISGKLSAESYAIIDEMRPPKWLKDRNVQYKFKKLIEFIRSIDEVVLLIRPQDADILGLYCLQTQLLEDYIDALGDGLSEQAPALRREISKCTTTILDIQTKLLFNPVSRSKLNLNAEKEDAITSEILSGCGLNQ